MRIAYVANARIPTEKAHGVQIMHTCAALAARGHEVHLIVPRRSTRADDPFEFYGVPRSFTVSKVWCLDWTAYGQFGFFTQTITFAFSVMRAVSKLKPDVVYGRDPAALNAVRHPVRVFELHTALSTRFNRFTHVVAISQGLATYALSRGVPEDRVSVLHDATTIEPLEDKAVVRQALGLPSDLILVGYVGKYKTMGVEKGVRAIVDSVGVLNRTTPVGMLVVGLEESEVPALRDTAQAAAIPEDRRFFMTHVPYQRARRFMRAADILVMNYPNQQHFAFYMSPLKLFEYLASGNPMVSSDLPSVREIVDDRSSILITPDSTAALTHALGRLVTDPKLREQIGMAGYELAKGYSYEARAKHIEEIVSRYVRMPA